MAALVRLGSPDAFDAVSAALQAPNVEARRAAAAALVARRGDKGSLLENAANSDPDSEVRRICAAALGH